MREALRQAASPSRSHEILAARRRPRPGRPYGANQLVGTITTSTSHIRHPDGTRNLTIGEYASLQGFPPTHRFIRRNAVARRLVDNAFLPSSIKVLYAHLNR
jgi:DNA (cytosine-5)-methyltransferase 1